MSVVINTNAAATMAAANLASSNAHLQRSLNRLSTGSRLVMPADDAGGMAVSMKLSAMARRQSAVIGNVANATSYLQTQDGVLNAVGKVLSRISELKTLALDPTKNSSDVGNYNAEFTQLKSQLGNLAAETFNGVALFASTALTVPVDESGTSSVTMAGVNLLGASGGAAWSNLSGVTPGVGWTSSSPFITNSGGDTAFHGDGTLTTTQTNIAGPYTMSFTFTEYNASGAFTVSNGGNALNVNGLSAAIGVNHTLAISVDSNGDATWSFNGGAQTGAVAGFGSPSGAALTFTNSGGADVHIHDNFTLTSTVSGTGNIYAVQSGASLSAVSLATISSALEEVATFRANNGALQSRLGFASEVLTTNKANIEAANSRITDVDVAEESTRLARYNILSQAGTSMLSQANQSTQIALKLLG